MKLNENSKITLTMGQLKRLVAENGSDSKSSFGGYWEWGGRRGADADSVADMLRFPGTLKMFELSSVHETEFIVCDDASKLPFEEEEKEDAWKLEVGDTMKADSIFQSFAKMDVTRLA